MTIDLVRPAALLAVACAVAVSAGCEPGDGAGSATELSPATARLVRSAPSGSAIDPDTAKGRELYMEWGCYGCHGTQGGGGMGPSLTDAEWLYGSDSESIFTSVKEGRPRGMPGYAGRPDEEIRHVVAYILSLQD